MYLSTFNLSKIDLTKSFPNVTVLNKIPVFEEALSFEKNEINQGIGDCKINQFICKLNVNKTIHHEFNVD